MDIKQWELRTHAALDLSLAEIAWWQGRVAEGLVSAEHAAGYISIEEGIVRTKRAVLGL